MVWFIRHLFFAWCGVDGVSPFANSLGKDMVTRHAWQNRVHEVSPRLYRKIAQ